MTIKHYELLDWIVELWTSDNLDGIPEELKAR